MPMVREIPCLDGIPPSPTNIKHLRRLHEYGESVVVPFPRNLAVFLLEFYQLKTVDKPHVCNHFPSCSEYARICFMMYGFFSAFFLTMEHLRECSDPFSEWPKEIRP